MAGRGCASEVLITATLVFLVLFATAPLAHAASGTFTVSGTVDGATVSGSGQWSYTVSGGQLTGQASYHDTLTLPPIGGGCAYSPSSVSSTSQETWSGPVQNNIATITDSGVNSGTGSLTLTCPNPAGPPIVSTVPGQTEPYTLQLTLNLATLQSGVPYTVSYEGFTETLTQTSGSSASTVQSTVATVPTTASASTTVSTLPTTTIFVPPPNMPAQDQNELLALVKRFGQSAWQSTSTTLDCAQQLASTGNSCTENDHVFTFSLEPPSLQDMVIDTINDKVKDGILKFFGEEFVAPYGYVEAGQQVYVVGQGVYEISQILQVPLGAGSESNVGPIVIGMQPTAYASWTQSQMMNQGIYQDIAQWAATHQSSVQVLQVQLGSSGQIVGVTDEPTEAVQLDCASSASCTPGILAGVSGLHSVFVLAIPIPSNLSAGRFGNLTSVPLNQSGANASILNATNVAGVYQVLNQNAANQTAAQAANTTGQQQNQPTTGDEIIGLAILLLIFLFFLAIVRGIYKAIKARLAGQGGSAGSGGGAFGKGGGRPNSGKRQAEAEPPQRQQQAGGDEDENLRILKVRYAKGEITKKQFDRMRKDLE
jgi:Short C-terminal domain